MYPVIGHIGPLTIYTYGLCYAIGLSCGFFFVNKWAKEVDFDEDDVLNLFIILILTTVGGARLTYVLSYPEHFATWTDRAAISCPWEAPSPRRNRYISRKDIHRNGSTNS